MTCSDFQILISAWLDDALQPEEASRLASHLEDCPSCRAHQQRLLGTRELLRSWRIDAPVVDVLPQAQPAAGSFGRILAVLLRGQIRVPVPLAVAIAVLFAALAFIALHGEVGSSPRPQGSVLVTVQSLEPDHDLIVLGGEWGGLEPEGGWKEER